MDTVSRERTSTKPSILMLATSGSIGGVERVATSLAHGLGQRGYPIHLVFAQTPRDAALISWCRDHGVEAGTHAAVLPSDHRHTVRDLLALRRFIRRRQPDIVNVHYGHNFISLKDVLAVRLAGHHRCIVSVHHPAEWDNARKRGMTYLAARLCDAIIVPSHAMRDTLRAAGVPARKIYRIPNGAPVPQSLPARRDARTRLGLPANAFVVASLARLVQDKGIADLVKAVATIPDPSRTLMLVVAGDGPERPALEKISCQLLQGRALFLGRIQDTADFYAAADVFALPSYMEGFGLVYVEAAFHGVPSIGTRVGGVPDAVVDGETGLLVAAGNSVALAAAIQHLRDDPALRQRLGARAQARAYAEFTEAHMAEHYAAVLQSCTGPH